MAKTIKAVRAEIFLGDIPLSVYQMPDGSYKLSGRNVTDAIDETPNSLLRAMGVKSLDLLPHATSERYRISAGKEGSPFVPVSIEDATEYWGRAAKRGNDKAIAILVASAIEAIERRADNVLNVTRAEEERQEKFKARVNGIKVRRTFTDAINAYIERHPELSENRAKYLYNNATDRVYKAVFGRITRVLTKDLQISGSLRDHLTEDELRHIALIEEEAMYIIDRQDIEPCEAVLMARAKFSFDISQRPEIA